MASAKDMTTQTPDWPASAFETADIKTDNIIVFGKRNEPASLDAPKIVPVALSIEVQPRDPVIVVTQNGETRAYPLTIVAAHEVVNDTLGGVPIAVTYCRICSAAVVFDRRIDGAPATKFHLAGFLTNNNIVLFDAATERWWQQYDGMKLSDSPNAPMLSTLRSEVTSYQRFVDQHSDSDASVVLKTDLARLPLAAGTAPVVLDEDGLPLGVSAEDRLVIIGQQAFPLARLRDEGEIESGDLVLKWEPGRDAAPDIFGRDANNDAGHVTAFRRATQRPEQEDILLPESFRINLAHSFRTFVEDGRIEADD